jgi:hypothetical protein
MDRLLTVKEATELLACSHYHGGSVEERSSADGADERLGALGLPRR